MSTNVSVAQKTGRDLVLGTNHLPVQLFVSCYNSCYIPFCFPFVIPNYGKG